LDSNTLEPLRKKRCPRIVEYDDGSEECS